jgi:hypothetical protein
MVLSASRRCQTAFFITDRIFSESTPSWCHSSNCRLPKTIRGK